MGKDSEAGGGFVFNCNWRVGEGYLWVFLFVMVDVLFAPISSEVSMKFCLLPAGTVSTRGFLKTSHYFITSPLGRVNGISRALKRRDVYLHIPVKFDT